LLLLNAVISLVQTYGGNLIAGAGNPGGGVGSNGQYFLDTNTENVWGPKTSGSWGASPASFGNNHFLEITANTVLQFYNQFLEFDNSGSYTATIADATGHGNDEYTVYNNGEQVQTLHSAGAAQFSTNGSLSSSVTLSAGQIVDLVSDNTNWIVKAALNGTNGEAGSVGPAGLNGAITAIGENITIYVYTNGNDSNEGLTPETALLTLQHAWQVLLASFMNGFTATIQMGPGTFTNGLYASCMPVGVPSMTALTITGTPGETTIHNASFNCINADGPVGIYIENLTLLADNGSCLYAANGASITCGTGMNFGASSAPQVSAEYAGSVVLLDDYTISGSSYAHLSAVNCGSVQDNNNTITLSGVPAFNAGGSSSFAISSGSSSLSINACTFSGTATGPRYNVVLSSTIYTGDAGATHLPGDSSGASANGGIYF
jgi:hypothetical protein